MLSVSASMDSVVSCLNLTEFGHIRTTNCTLHRLLSVLERQVLRHSVERLATAGRVNQIELQDVLQQQHWASLIHIAGWLQNGMIGQSLCNLRERLTTWKQMWDYVLTERTPSNSDDD